MRAFFVYFIPCWLWQRSFQRDASGEPAGAADDSDAPAAARLQARAGLAPFDPALGRSRSSAQVRRSRPSRSRPEARARRRRRLRPWLRCPRSSASLLSLVVHAGSEAMLWLGRIFTHRVAMHAVAPPRTQRRALPLPVCRRLAVAPPLSPQLASQALLPRPTTARSHAMVRGTKPCHGAGESSAGAPCLASRLASRALALPSRRAGALSSDSNGALMLAFRPG